MPFPIGKILMAYRPLYLRGLLMDGQYKLPASNPATTGKRADTPAPEAKSERLPTVIACKPLRGATP
ncbi:MAG TPA: hypothetical protein VFG49_11100 [Dyella sp.]|uniref:hypothetical protein n=1 Tax=Dyella sp. TaxID=1869338 RepID=UPI002D79360B|nr:hypothetical protein [Dyella sp.]HET6554072.1 hypothetical protein [Dyella sp.]